MYINNVTKYIYIYISTEFKIFLYKTIMVSDHLETERVLLDYNMN